MEQETFLTTAQVAAELGVTRERVLALIRDKRIRAAKHGRDWAIREEDLEPVRHRKPGRPKMPVPTM